MTATAKPKPGDSIAASQRAESLYAILADLAAHGAPAPAFAGLAEMVGVSTTTVCSYVKELRRTGRVVLHNPAHGTVYYLPALRKATAEPTPPEPSSRLHDALALVADHRANWPARDADHLAALRATGERFTRDPEACRREQVFRPPPGRESRTLGGVYGAIL